MKIGRGDRTTDRVDAARRPCSRPRPSGRCNSRSRATRASRRRSRSPIDRFAAVPEAGMTDSARAAHDGQAARHGRRRHRPRRRRGLLPLRREGGEQVGVQVVAAELGSKLDPVLVLTDATGTVLAEGSGRYSASRIPKAGTVRRRRPRPRVPRRGGLHATACTSATCRSSPASSRSACSAAERRTSTSRA